MSRRTSEPCNPGNCAPAVGCILQINIDRYNNQSKKRVFRLPYFLLRTASTAPAAPNPARIPITGTGLFAAGVSVGVGVAVAVFVGFTVGISYPGTGVRVGVGVAVSQMEVPSSGLLPPFFFSTGVS